MSNVTGVGRRGITYIECLFHQNKQQGKWLGRTDSYKKPWDLDSFFINFPWVVNKNRWFLTCFRVYGVKGSDFGVGGTKLHGCKGLLQCFRRTQEFSKNTCRSGGRCSDPFWGHYLFGSRTGPSLLETAKCQWRIRRQNTVNKTLLRQTPTTPRVIEVSMWGDTNTRERTNTHTRRNTGTWTDVNVYPETQDFRSTSFSLCLILLESYPGRGPPCKSGRDPASPGPLYRPRHITVLLSFSSVHNSLMMHGLHRFMKDI